jgi:hypothetical protein
MFDVDGSGGATTGLVTVLVRDHTFRWVRMNGTAVRPQIGADGAWLNYLPRNFTILIRDLTEAT